MDRRQILATSTAAGVQFWLGASAAADRVRLVFVHGRAQQHLDPSQLKDDWLSAFRRGLASGGATIPPTVEAVLPYYGDLLDSFSRQFDVPLTSDIRSRGGEAQDEFLVFQAELADSIRERAGISDEQLNAEYGPNPKPRGPLNWEWVQAILRSIDKYGGGISQQALEIFTRDVFLYTTRPTVRTAIDDVVARAFDDAPTVVVAHSLGTVVGYNVLCKRTAPKTPLYVSLGCPLGIKAIRKQLVPLRFPTPPVAVWLNAFDRRDVVSLFPLDASNFPVEPTIENYGGVNNSTENRHGISGYLDDKHVSARILSALRA